jgi:small-conductance mechanosensitive channel
VYLALILGFAVAPPTSGGSMAPATGEAPAEQKIEVIPAADIPDRANSDEQFIQTAARRSDKANQDGIFEQRLMSLSLGVKQLAAHSNSLALSTLSLPTLENLRRHWQFYEREISRWRFDLQRITKVSLEDSAGLTSRRAIWRATRLSIADAAPALLQRVDEMIGHIDQADAAMSPSISKLLVVGRRGDVLLAEVKSGKADVVARKADEDRRLLAIDSPPLWQAAGGEETTRPVDAGMRESLQIDRAFTRDYDAAHVKAVRIAITCGALLLPLMLWLRHRVKRSITAGQTTASSMQALLHPWSAWLVLVALGEVLFGSRGPMIRQFLAILLAWIPVLRLLPSQVLTIVSPWAYLTAACYFLNAAASLLISNGIWYRSLLLIIDVIALGSLIWLRSRVRRPTPVIGAPKKRGLLEFLLVVAGAVLVVSVGSNLLGNVSLATMLTGAVLDSGFLAMVLYAGATVLAALLQQLLLGPAVSRLSMYHASSLAQAGVRVGRTLLIAAWLVSVLQFFRIYRPLLDWLVAVFSYHFKVGSLSISFGSSVGFIAAAWVAIWLAKTVRLVLAEDILPAVSLPRGLGNTISTLTYYAVLFLGLLAALAIAGFQIGELAIAFGALGVGIGFGLQDVVKNFVSGLILMFERPIQPGDVVDIAGTSGTVRDIGMRATILTTPDGAEVVVPNGMLLADKLVNWTLRARHRRINVDVVTTYGADPMRTIELLAGIAAHVEGIAAVPPPAAILTGLASGALQFNVNAWTTESADWVIVRSLLNVKIREGLAAAGIEVPAPQRDLRLRSVSKASEQELLGGE